MDSWLDTLWKNKSSDHVEVLLDLIGEWGSVARKAIRGSLVRAHCLNRHWDRASWLRGYKRLFLSHTSFSFIPFDILHVIYSTSTAFLHRKIPVPP